jgi:hypothetical protein
MIEKAAWSKMDLKSGGAQIPLCPRRLKFGPFSKELCFVIGDKLANLAILADYRRISQESKGPPDGFPKVPVWKNQIASGCPQSALGGLWGRPEPHVDNLPKWRLETRNQQLNRKEELIEHENALTSPTRGA